MKEKLKFFKVEQDISEVFDKAPSVVLPSSKEELFEKLLLRRGPNCRTLITRISVDSIL